MEKRGIHLEGRVRSTVDYGNVDFEESMAKKVMVKLGLLGTASVGRPENM